MATADGGASAAPPLDCLVIGAGISGLLAAQALRVAGYRVLVVDKGRGVGGRMACRRVGTAHIDHGAQFFTCRSAEFGALVASWVAGGTAVEWYRGSAAAAGEGHARYRGRPAMTAGPKRLGADHQVLTEARVEALALVGGAWAARIEGGRRITAQAVVASAPVPQTLALLDAGAAPLPAALRAELDLVEYAPCIAVLARLSRPSGMPPPGAVALEDGALRWIADNQLKGVSDVPALTLHAAPSFSRAHLAATDADITARLLAAAAPHATLVVDEVQVHRWRYAEPTRGPSARCLSTPLPAPIVFCGDAFGGPRVEGAALSGLAAGRRAAELLAERCPPLAPR